MEETDLQDHQSIRRSDSRVLQRPKFPGATRITRNYVVFIDFIDLFVVLVAEHTQIVHVCYCDDSFIPSPLSCTSVFVIFFFSSLALFLLV
ncbi:hypothetical protein ANCCAN_24705 [Ancylostoma caninum]|uniref:Uncharacterized protein n=1 Tax=Ancylostoma caninum TaxID=29170 RepID=A0A368FBI7_ANCCA|nr:hypothetical protein ANCCAN_24705 [Ancylostoma caninum]